MFVGHIGAGLVLKKMEPRINLGVFFLAVMFADLLLWPLVLLGIESVVAPEEFAAKHYFTFVFPYSHGLATTFIWSLLAGLWAWTALGPAFQRRSIAALVVALAVFSHFILDAIVHIPDLPLLGEHSYKIGLGLWRQMPLEIAVELLLSGAALFFFIKGSGLRRSRIALAVGLVVFLGAMTAAGPYMTPEPPPASVQAMSAFITLVVVVLIGFWIDGRISLVVPSPSEAEAR